jgi:hypothetical protein
VKNLLLFLKSFARWLLDEKPFARVLMAATVVADAFPELATQPQLGKAKVQLLNNSAVETTTAPLLAKPAKPKRKRARKPKVLLAAPAEPEPPPPEPDAWLKKLREKRRSILITTEAENISPNVGSALVRGTIIHREVGETTADFVHRIRGIGGSSVEWREYPPEKSRLSIIEDALHRPLKADGEAVGWDDILPEDLQNWHPDHRVVH